MTLSDQVYRAAQTSWNAQVRLDTLTGLLNEAGEYGLLDAQWLRERRDDLVPVFEGLQEVAGILLAVVTEMEMESDNPCAV